MWLILYSKISFGLDLPAPPEASEPKPGQCKEAMGVTYSKPIKFGDESCTATCSGVLMPTSIAADYIIHKSWSSDMYMVCQSELDFNKLQFQELHTDHKKQLVYTAMKYSLYGMAAGALISLFASK